jgi:cytochrome P450
MHAGTEREHLTGCHRGVRGGSNEDPGVPHGGSDRSVAVAPEVGRSLFEFPGEFDRGVVDAVLRQPSVFEAPSGREAMTEHLPPPAPGGRPLVGHTLSFVRGPLDALDRWGEAEDGVLTARVAGRTVVVVTEPAPVREVLVADTGSYRKAGVVRERLGTLQGGSLVLLEGEQWRDRRRTAEAAFGPDRAAATASLTTRYAAETVEAWPADGVVRADRQARTLSLSILSRALFGLDLRGDRTPIHRAAEDVLARMDLQSPSAYLPEWVPTPTNRRFRRAVATLHDRLDDVVERRTDRESTGEDLLSVMAEAGVDPGALRDELVAFLFAGFDSTATALSCTLGLLGNHRSVREDLREELDTVLGDRLPTHSDLQDLPLLDAVVRESLRLYPPQYVLFREPTTRVSLGGHRIPEGTTVVLAPWTCHRDGSHWAYPERFRPRRWLEAGDLVRDHDRPEFAYFPYGGGPRHCLGVRLANRILRLVVAVVCIRRRFETVGEVSVSAGPTLSLDGGVELHTRRR